MSSPWRKDAPAACDARSLDCGEPPVYATNGLVDYRGEPASVTKTGGWRAAPLILGAEMCERLSTFAITLNLVTYLVGHMHLPIAKSSNIVTNFLGTSYVLCLLGGFVADTYLGRFRTIAAAAAIQCLGMVMLTLSASLPMLKPPKCTQLPCHEAHGLVLSSLYIGLYLIAVGNGGIKACVSSFGADQFDDHIPREKEEKAHFFNWFFLFISFGALIAATIFVYIQDEMGRAWGFGFSAATMLIAMCALWGGVPLYRFQIVQGSPLTLIAKVLVAAVRNYKLVLPADPAMLHEVRDEEVAHKGSLSRVPHTDQFRCLDRAAIPLKASSPEEYSAISPWKMCTVTQVEDVKQFLKMLPIWCTTSLCYTVYAQMHTFSVEQGQTLRRQLGSHFVIPPASVGVFLQIGVMSTVIFYDRVFVPVTRQFTGLDKGITSLQRMGIGLVISALAMLVAAWVETKRVHKARSVFDPSIPMSVFWLLPQFFLVGASEAFTYVGQLDFFYNEAPAPMRSMATGLCLSTISVGYFTSTFLVETVNRCTRSHSHPGWLEGNFNRGKLYNFYWILAIISAFNFLAFIACAWWYKYKTTVAQNAPQSHGIQVFKTSSLPDNMTSLADVSSHDEAVVKKNTSTT